MCAERDRESLWTRRTPDAFGRGERDELRERGREGKERQTAAAFFGLDLQLCSRMEVLQRALSTRAMATASATKEDPLDASKHIEHIAEEELDDRVTGSSVAAISTFLNSAEVRKVVSLQQVYLCLRRA